MPIIVGSSWNFGLCAALICVYAFNTGAKTVYVSLKPRVFKVRAIVENCLADTLELSLVIKNDAEEDVILYVPFLYSKYCINVEYYGDSGKSFSSDEFHAYDITDAIDDEGNVSTISWSSYEECRDTTRRMELLKGESTKMQVKTVFTLDKARKNLGELDIKSWAFMAEKRRRNSELSNEFFFMRKDGHLDTSKVFEKIQVKCK